MNQHPKLTIERTGEFGFTVKDGRHALQCGYVIRTTGTGTCWRVCIEKIASDWAGIATGQMRYESPIAAADAVRSIAEAMRTLGGGSVEVYAADGLLFLGQA